MHLLFNINSNFYCNISCWKNQTLRFFLEKIIYLTKCVFLYLIVNFTVLFIFTERKTPTDDQVGDISEIRLRYFQY